MTEVELKYDGIPAPFLVRDRLTQGYTRPPLLLNGNGNIALGQKTAAALGNLICQRNDVKPAFRDLLMSDLYAEPVGHYPDGHRRIHSVSQEFSGRKVFIFQNPWPKPDIRLFETFLMIDAVRRGGADSITAVIPYFAYGRGDRKNAPRVPIEASIVAQILEFLGINRLITLDLHAEQTMGAIKEPWDNLYASHLMIPRILKDIDSSDGIIMSTDAGGLKRAIAHAKRIKARGIAFVIKEREVDETSSHPNSLLFIGDVHGRSVAIIDDESVSLASVKTAVTEAANNGANKILACISHLKDADAGDNEDFPKMWENLNTMPPEFVRLVTTDSVDHLSQIRNHPLVEVLDTSAFWAEVIWRTAFGVRLGPDLID